MLRPSDNHHARWQTLRPSLTEQQAHELEAALPLQAVGWRIGRSESVDGSLTLLLFHEHNADLSFVFEGAAGGVRLVLKLGDTLKDCGSFATMRESIARLCSIIAVPWD